MEYINRRGQTYFAFQGTTKTGKPKYFASKKPSSPKAARVQELPSDFEFFENPANATVVIRRRKKTLLTVAEGNLLSRLALEHCQVACEVVTVGNALVVYAGPALCPDPALESMMPGVSRAIAASANLEPGFRFKLVDVQDRSFAVERYCYRGSIDGWWPLHGPPAPLEALATEFLPHLGQESFFELM